MKKLALKVSWDEPTRKVTIVKGDMNIQLVIDSKTALIKGKKENLEVAPIIEKGNTMLPLRFIGQLMGIEFKWDSLTSSVHMFKNDDSDSKPVTGPIDVVDEPQSWRSNATKIRQYRVQALIKERKHLMRMFTC